MKIILSAILTMLTASSAFCAVAESVEEKMPTAEELRASIAKTEADLKADVENLAKGGPEKDMHRFKSRINYFKSMLEEQQAQLEALPIHDAIVAKLNTPVSLEIDNLPLSQALVKVKDVTGIDVVVGKYIKDKAIKLKAKDMLIRDALWSIAQQADAVWKVGLKTVDLEVLKIPDDAWKQDIEAKLQRKASLEFVDTPFDEAVGMVRSLVNVTLITDPRLAVKDKMVNLRVKDMMLRDLVESVARLSGAKLSIIDGAVYLYPDGPIPAGRKISKDEVDPKNVEALKALERHVTFEFVDTPFDDAINFFSQLTKIGVGFDSGMNAQAKQRSVTMRCSDMPLIQALNWMCRLAGNEWDIQAGALIFSKADGGLNQPPAKTGEAGGGSGALRVKFSGGAEVEADAALLQQFPQLGASILEQLNDPVKDGLLAHAMAAGEDVADIKGLIVKAAPTAKFDLDAKTQILLITAGEPNDLRRAQLALRAYASRMVKAAAPAEAPKTHPAP